MCIAVRIPGAAQPTPIIFYPRLCQNTAIEGEAQTRESRDPPSDKIRTKLRCKQARPRIRRILSLKSSSLDPPPIARAKAPNTDALGESLPRPYDKKTRPLLCRLYGLCTAAAAIRYGMHQPLTQALRRLRERKKRAKSHAHPPYPSAVEPIKAACKNSSIRKRSAAPPFVRRRPPLPSFDSVLSA